MAHRRSTTSDSDWNFGSVYKHPSLPRKHQLCAICMLRTRGRTVEVHLTHGVSVWLCADTHATPEFMQRSGGRELARLLTLVWSASCRLHANRQRALQAHVDGIAAVARRDEARLPGSYHRKATRNEAEHRYAAGEDPRTVSRDLRQRHAHDVAEAPSERTMRGWFADGRWRRGVRTRLRPGFERRDQARAARAQRASRPSTAPGAIRSQARAP